MFTLLSLLSACATVPLPEACEDVVAPPVVACFGGDGLDYPGYGSLDAAVDGTVVSVTTGARPDACLVDVGNAALHDGVIVEIEDDAGARYTVAYAIPDLAGTLVSVGDAVSLQATYTYGEFGPDVGSVFLGLTDTGAVVLLLGTAGELEDLPGAIEATEGAPRCTQDDGCGAFSKYDLDVTVGSRTATVPYGEAADVGEGARFVNGGYDHQADDAGGTCPDWYVAHVTLAVVDEDESGR